jgi:hypothetical protein
MQKYKLVVHVPLTHTDAVREAMGMAGAGRIGNYAHCSFLSIGTGRFLPLEGAEPHIGAVGVPEATPEERIEVTVTEDVLDGVIAALKKVHPYEEVTYDVYRLENK